MSRISTAVVSAVLSVFIASASVPGALAEVQSESVGGVRIFTWDASPRTQNVEVVCLPGLGLCARGYEPLANELRNLGITTHVIDAAALGHTAGVAKHERVSLSRTATDIRSALDLIHKRTPNCRIVLLGESIGAVLALRLASESTKQIDGIICAAPAWKIYGLPATTVKGLMSPLESRTPGMAARGIIRQVTIKPELRKHLSTDPAHVVDFSISEAVMVTRLMAHAPNYAARISTTPVLFVQGMQDALVKPNAVAALFKKIPTANKTFVLDMHGEHLVFEEGQFNKHVIQTTAQWIKSVERSEEFVTAPIGLTVASDYKDASMDEARKLFKTAGVEGNYSQAAMMPETVAADISEWTATHPIP